jgi:hypothetical protein
MWRELLPHVFTIAVFCKMELRLLFSVALAVSEIYRSLPVRKYGALCCPDFPPRFVKRIVAIERAVAYFANIINFLAISMKIVSFVFKKK